MEIELLIERLLMQHTLKRSEVDSLCQKAAQLIEELQAENERLKGALSNIAEVAKRQQQPACQELAEQALTNEVK